MTDNEWKQKINAITDPVELWKALLQLDKEISGLGDPYYRDFYMTIINRAEQLVAD